MTLTDFWRGLSLALFAALLSTSAQAALSPADAEVKAIFGVLPWHEYAEQPLFGILVVLHAAL